jgi:hypothetical protein
MSGATTVDVPSTHPEWLEARLDRIAARLEALAEAQAAERRERERWADLVHELTPVAQAAMAMASDELAELNRDVGADDVTRFARTLVRSLPQLEALLAQLASAGELLHEVTSLTGDGMGALSDALARAEQRGYFAAARSGGAVLDRMAAVLAADAADGAGPAEPPSALALLRQLRDPQTRRGLARALDLVRALGDAPTTAPSSIPTPTKD